MGTAYIRNLEVDKAPYVLSEIVNLSPGSPPDRPTPGPNPPGVPGWPDAGPPPWGIEAPPGVTGPGGPGGGLPQPPEGSKVVLIAKAAEQPPAPEGLPAGSVLMDVTFAPGQKGQAWGLPYVSPHG